MPSTSFLLPCSSKFFLPGLKKYLLILIMYIGDNPN